VRRSSVGVVRRTGAVLRELEDGRFGSTLRVGVDCRLVVSDRLGTTRRDVGSVWRCGVVWRVGTARRLDASPGRAASGVRPFGVTTRRPAASGWLCVPVGAGRAVGVIVRRPSVMPQPEGSTRRPDSERVAVGVPRPAVVGVATVRRPAPLAAVGETCRPVARSAVGLTRRPAVFTTVGALRRPPCSAAYREPRSECSPLPLDGEVRRRVSMPPRAISYRPLSFQAYRPR
jgi:hypothetical protein